MLSCKTLAVRRIAQMTPVFWRLGSRCLSFTAVRHNMVQDLYLKELRQIKKFDAASFESNDAAKEGVIDWVPPAKPTLPGLEAEGPEALHDYINQTVETAATSDAPAETEGVQTAPASMDLAADDWLVIEDVEDEAPHH